MSISFEWRVECSLIMREADHFVESARLIGQQCVPLTAEQSKIVAKVAIGLLFSKTFCR